MQDHTNAFDSVVAGAGQIVTLLEQLFSTAKSAERLDERGMRRQTLYLPPEVYEQIREITVTERTSQQAFFREAIDLAFAARGLRSWGELSPSMKGKREK